MARSPYETWMARRRRGFALTWCLFLLVVAAAFGYRIWASRHDAQAAAPRNSGTRCCARTIATFQLEPARRPDAIILRERPRPVAPFASIQEKPSSPA
jgi:hypothetical protein